MAIPMYPVPITLQTFAVLLVGGFLGRRLGVFVVGLWLCLAMAGLPLLADGRGGLETFLGPTGGYLAAFVPMAWMTAHFTSQREGSFFLLDLITCVVAHALCLGLGVLWLSRFIPFEDAFTEGALPFLL
ncbi:MAG: biotin transporter BioY, partial [Pseudomonadota bacterium]